MLRKILWLITSKKKDKDFIAERAKSIGAEGVCIRTDNDWLKESIGEMQQLGLKVYGWRWPSVKPGGAAHRYAPEEAQFVVQLIGAGLDGYIADPESDHSGDDDDWDDAKWADLAANFCDTIRNAGRQNKPNFLFGVTSGCTYPQGKPNIPWAQFVARSEVLIPQTYWRNESGDINGKSPKAAYSRGMISWKKIAVPGVRIVPMMGDINYTFGQEVDTFGQIIATNNHNEIHFYAASPNVSGENWMAMKRMGTAPLIACTKAENLSTNRQSRFNRLKAGSAARKLRQKKSEKTKKRSK